MTFFPYLKPEGRAGTIEEQFTGGHRVHDRVHHESPVRTGERPQIDLIGEAVALGPLQGDLLPRYQSWLNYYGDSLDNDDTELVDCDEFAEFPEDLISEYDDVFFTVYEMGSWRAIGGAALTEIDYDEAVAEFSIIIGESECRGRGYGTESTRLVLDYAFNALGLTNVMLRVFEYNYTARGAFERAGFREFSRRRDCHLEGSRLWDEIYMGCLASEFNSSMGIRIQMLENLNA